jgi:hypothetical protein
MQLPPILIGSFLAIILLCNSCTARSDRDDPFRECTTAIFSGNRQKCVGIFLQSFMANQDWSKDEPRKLCGHQCTSNRKGYFSNFEWVWEVRYRCDSEAPGIMGSGTGKSRAGAMHWASEDFINKTVATGRFKDKDFRCGKPTVGYSLP